MKTEILGIRMNQKMKREIEIISKILNISPSEWVRNKIAENIQKTLEEMRYQIILAYIRGNITKEELKEVFGEIAEDIDFIIDKTKKDLLKAEELAKEMK